MERARVEALDHHQLVEAFCRLQTVAVEYAERLSLNSTNSSKPPSSDPPFGGNGLLPGLGGPTLKPAAGASAVQPAKKAPSGRKPGKQPGSPGTWRREPLKPERSEHHWPAVCERCGTAFEMWDAHVGTAAACTSTARRRVLSGTE